MPETIVEQTAADQEFQHKKAALRALVEKDILRKSPYLLGKNILGFDRYTDNHKIWDKWVRIHIDIAGKKPSKSLILQPRECFKTTFFSVNLAINFLLCNPDTSILIVSSNNTNAAAILRQIKSILERNEKFIKLFGNWVDDKNWNAGEIIVKPRKNHNQKEGSITAVGRGNQITSKHYDTIIFDDIVTSDDRDSPAIREATKLYFMDMWDILKKDCGKILVIGTRWHINDLYAHIFELDKKLPLEDKFNILITPAIAEDGTLNFPQILSQKKLDELRILKVGTDAMDQASFEAQYMLRPLSSHDQIFKTFHYYDFSNTQYEVGIMYIDPAISTKESACFSACVIVAKIKNGEHKGKWAVPYASLAKRAPTTLMHDIIELHKLFVTSHNCECCCYIESNNFQALLKDNTIKMALQDGYNLPITGKTTVTNKDLRITSLEPYVTQGFLLFRSDWNTAPGNYAILMQQLKEFPQAAKDGPDALAMGHEVSRGRYFNIDLKEEGTNQ